MNFVWTASLMSKPIVFKVNQSPGLSEVGYSNALTLIIGITDTFAEHGLNSVGFIIPCMFSFQIYQ